MKNSFLSSPKGQSSKAWPALAALTLATSCAQAQNAPPQAPRKMNVLFIAVDDLNTDLGAYGRSDVKSPHIDALAARGLLFSRAYCQQAVCSPSRTSLLTGRYPDTTRIFNLTTHFRDVLPDVVTLPQQFKLHGYTTQSIGKIYHGGLDDPPSWTISSGGQGGGGAERRRNQRRGGRRQQGAMNFAPANFQTIAGETATGETDYTRVPADRKALSWAMPDVPDNALSDGQEAERAIAALGQLQRQPFFLAVGFHKPHLPFVAPKKYFDLYPLASIKLPNNMFPPKGAPPLAFANFGELRGFKDIKEVAPDDAPIPADKARELIRGYRAATSYTDAQIGRVLAELDRLKLRDNTIVVLWGDHGYHLGRNSEWVKHTNFEAATHVPLIISAPGQTTRGQKTNALVEFVDVYPTLCELAGLPLTPGLEGRSLVPLLKNPQAKFKAAALSQYPRGGPRGRINPHMGYTMRTDRYRFTQWIKADDKSVTATELYDHQTDPGETVNVAVRSENQALVAQLAAQLRQSFPALSAPGPLPLLSAPEPRRRNAND